VQRRSAPGSRATRKPRSTKALANGAVNLRAFICFGAGGERSYGIAARLAWSPKPAVMVPEYFNASVATVHVTEYMIALIAPRHCCCPLTRYQVVQRF
jgi:hypothetical protein